MTLLSEWARLKKQLDKQDGQVLGRLVAAYGLTYMRITPQITALMEQMDAQLISGKLTKASISESAAYKNLIRSIEDELTAYEGYLRTEVSLATTAAAKSGLSSGKFLMIAALADAMGIAIADVPRNLVANATPDALNFLADYLDPRGALFGKIQYLSGYHSTEIAQGILDQVAQGVNPKVIANWITDEYGVGLTDSMRMMRTSQLYSYRQASRAVTMANADVLQGQVWCATLDDVCCDSCVALHGTWFPADAICDDHHNGHCALLPWIDGVENPVGQTGEEWFNEQDEKTQVDRLGQTKYDLYKGGQMNFSDLSHTYEDPVFGTMRGATPLWEILGAEPPVRTK
jgi:hypothetical protein